MDSSTISAILAAASVLAGVTLSQIFSWLNKGSERKHEYRLLLLDKFEEVALRFAASNQWAADLGNANSFEELRNLSLSVDANHALVLCKLYFPEMVKPLEQYVLAQVAWYQYVATCYHKSGRMGNVGAIAIMNPQYEPLLNKVFQTKEAVLRVFT
jgi:hypothetical protein